MVSSFVIAAAEGFEPEDRPRVVDKIVANSQFVASEPEKPSRKRFGGGRPFCAAAAPQSPRGPPVDDDLEEGLEDKLHFSINELADLAGKSPATIFRYLRLGQMPCIRVGGHRQFTRAVVLDFLRNERADVVPTMRGRKVGLRDGREPPRAHPCDYAREGRKRNLRPSAPEERSTVLWGWGVPQVSQFVELIKRQ